jgi:hypothetical protein
MLATSQKPTNARVHFLLIAAVCFGFSCTSVALGATTESLVAWAEHAAPKATYDVEWSVPTTVDDHFGSVPYAEWRGGREQNGLALHGIDLPTADAGSTWVYDPAHHIAATTFSGDQTGDQIFYAQPPPSTISARNLSNIKSANGLTLGMTQAEAATDLRVPTAAVRRVDSHDSILSARYSYHCHYEERDATCGNNVIVLFRDGRAIYISLSSP